MIENVAAFSVLAGVGMLLWGLFSQTIIRKKVRAALYPSKADEMQNRFKQTRGERAEQASTLAPAVEVDDESFLANHRRL